MSQEETQYVSDTLQKVQSEISAFLATKNIRSYAREIGISNATLYRFRNKNVNIGKQQIETIVKLQYHMQKENVGSQKKRGFFNELFKGN